MKNPGKIPMTFGYCWNYHPSFWIYDASERFLPSASRTGQKYQQCPENEQKGINCNQRKWISRAWTVPFGTMFSKFLFFKFCLIKYKWFTLITLDCLLPCIRTLFTIMCVFQNICDRFRNISMLHDRRKLLLKTFFQE